MKISSSTTDAESLRNQTGTLKQSFPETLRVTGGQAGLSRRREEFDLVLVSSNLPDMARDRGLPALKVGCEHFLPVVIASQADTAEIRADGLDRGADDYLMLPLPDCEFIARIKSLLRIKSLHDRVRQLSAVREQVVYTVSHDFRTPLVGIRGAIQNMLSNLVGPLTADQREYLELVEQACQRLFELTDDMTRRARWKRDDSGQALASPWT